MAGIRTFRGPLGVGAPSAALQRCRGYRESTTVGSTAHIVERLDRNVDELCDGFAAHLALFDATDLFGGPSLYFHRKALDLRRRHSSVRALLEDEAFFDAAYATLTAWGMHRMGPGNTKLRDIEEIKDSVRENAPALERLATLDISTVGEAEQEGVVTDVWALVARLRVSVAEARIVANSKLLHHILPELVPPMDREYTFRFFYGRA